MYYTIETQVAQKRCDDLLRQAEHYQLVKEAMKGKARKHTYSRRFSLWLGKNLVSWGEKLTGSVPAVTVSSVALHEHNQPKAV